VGAALVRLFFLVGPVGTDDTNYMVGAHRLADGVAPDLDPGNVRAAFMLWLAVWHHLGFGGSALIFPQLLVEVALVGTLYWVGRRFVDERAALLSAVCWTLFPVELVYAGIVLPDQLGLLLALAALALAVDALRSEPGTGRGRLIAGAILAGLATSVREPYALVPVIVGAWGLWATRPTGIALRRAVVFGGVAFLVFLLEYPFFHLWTGDWLYRHHALGAVYGAGGTQEFPFWLGKIVYYISVVFDPFVSGLFGWLFLVALASSSLRNVRNPLLIALWTLAFYVFLQFAPTGLNPYQTLPMQPRYTLPIVVLLFFPLGCLLARLCEASVLRGTGTALLIVAIGVQAMSVAHLRIADGLYHSDMPRSVEAVLNATDKDWPKQPGISVLTFRKLPPDVQRRVEHWPRIDWPKAVRCDDGETWLLPVEAVLVPRIEILGAEDPALLCAVRWLERHAVVRNIVVPVTQIDRFLARAPIQRIRNRASMRPVGRLYLFERPR
jgi:hypothetical protein